MKILLASPFLAFPDTNGAKARILAFMKALTQRGHEVHFAYMGIDKADPEKVQELMAPFCVSCHDLRDEAYPWAEPAEDGYLIDDWVSDAQCDAFRAVHDDIQPDVTVVNYIFFSRLLEGLSSVKVIDLHDRLARAEQYEAINETPKFFYTTEARELEALTRADVALCIQDNERPYFEASGVPIVTVGHILPRNYVDRRYTRLRSVGYVGAYNIFNVHAINELLPRIAELHEAFPDIKLTLGGGICNAVEDGLPYVKKLGFVDDLSKFYADIDLCINPTIAGTGLKIKTVEALAHGAPLLTTKTGMDGLPVRTPMHDVSDLDEMLEALRQIKSQEFKQLTKLANLSKLIHTEYTASQHGAIEGLMAYCAGLAAQTPQTDLVTSIAPAGEAMDATQLKAPSTNERILHVLNPFHASAESDNYLAQPITFQSMADAKDFARNHVTVEVMNVHMADEEPVVHPVFDHTVPLSASSKDVLPDYPRSLPMLGDILSTAAAHEDADWIVYTNADIALTPGFYRRILEYTRDGYDAIVINRRTITKRISAVDQLAEAYGQIGRKHPGFDCFVFRRDLVAKMQLDQTLVGVHLIGRMLIWNLLRHAKNVKVEKEEHLTFHVGDDVPSKDLSEVEAIAHNFGQAKSFWSTVESSGETDRLKRAAIDAGTPDALNFGVGGLVAPLVVSNRSEAVSCPVHLHGHFRCGSTFLFRTLRRNPANMCFYEPFHEDIEAMSLSNLDQKRKLHSPSKFHKEHDGDWFFKESEALLLRNEGKMPWFRAAFGTEFFGDNRPNEEIEAYIATLIDHAYEEGRRPILQFNRSGLRMEFFTRTYPEHKHFFLLRDLNDQWNSYLRFMSDGRRGFLRSMLACISRGRRGDRLAPLARIMPLFDLGTDHALHQRYDPIFDQYTLEQLYICFYYTWMVSLFDAVKHDVSLINMSRIGGSPATQAAVDEQLVRAGIDVDWSNIKTDSYSGIGLSAESRLACESVANAVIAEMYDPDIETVLGKRGMGAYAAQVFDNALPDHEIQAALMSTASADGVELLTQSLVDIAAPAGRDHKKLEGLANRPQELPVVQSGQNEIAVVDGQFPPYPSGTAGFYRPEDSHVWTVNKLAGFAFRVPFIPQTLTLRLNMTAHHNLIDRGSQFSIDVNGVTLYRGPCEDWRWFDIEVPRSVAWRNRNGVIAVSLDAKMQAETGGDQRHLYFALSQCVVEYLPMS